MGIETQVSVTILEKQIDKDGDTLMKNTRSSSEMPPDKYTSNSTTLKKSASGATFSRLRIINSDNIKTSIDFPSESLNPVSLKLQPDVDASNEFRCTKNLGNPTTVSVHIVSFYLFI